MTTGKLLRVLGVGFGIAVLVGNTIGSGILRTPGEVAGHLPSVDCLELDRGGEFYALLVRKRSPKSRHDAGVGGTRCLPAWTRTYLGLSPVGAIGGVVTARGGGDLIAESAVALSKAFGAALRKSANRVCVLLVLALVMRGGGPPARPKLTAFGRRSSAILGDLFRFSGDRPVPLRPVRSERKPHARCVISPCTR